MLPLPADLLSPLPLSVPLEQLLLHAEPPGVYGVWIEPDPMRPPPRLPVSIVSGAGSVAFLLGADLAAVAARTARVLVRRGPGVACVPSCVLQSRRGLEVAGPDGRWTRVSLGPDQPEAVLADRLAAGRAVAASRVVYSVDSPRSSPLG